MVSKISFSYVMIITIMAVFVHSLGAMGLRYPELNRYIHLIFVISGLLLMIGLCGKFIWAYWLGLLFYVPRTLEYPFEAVRDLIYEKKVDLSYLAEWLGMVAALGAILFLMKRKKQYQKIEIFNQ